MKIRLQTQFLKISVGIYPQNNEIIFGSFESNSQLLQDDSNLNFSVPEDKFRSNNYFQLNYLLFHKIVFYKNLLDFRFHY